MRAGSCRAPLPGWAASPAPCSGPDPRPPPPLWSPGPAVWGGPSAAHHLSSPVLAPSPPLQDPLTSRPGALGPGEDKSESPGGPPPRRHPREGRESTELPRAAGLGGGQPGPPASLLTLPCRAPSREGALLRVGRGAALPAAPAPDRPASLPQSTASSGPAAMGTAARASRWSSWCSRSSTATRPSRSHGHTAASAPAAWVSGSRGAGGCHGARGTLPASGQGSPPPGSLCRPARGGGGSEAGRQQDRLGQLVGQPLWAGESSSGESARSRSQGAMWG